MAENEKRIDVVDTDLEFEEGEDAPQINEGDEDNTDYKALAAKNAGIAKRNATKLAKLKEKLKVDKKVEQKLEEKKNEPDYAKLAYLEGKGITSDEDIAWAEKQANDSGKSLRELFGAKWFQEELKERREETASKEAIPNGTKRSGNAARDTVEYYLASGKNPEDPVLARKVVKARIEAERQKNVFTDHPVV